MCGIVGYIGGEEAAPILLSGLQKLEYRGYDSAGVAVYNDTGLHVVKSKGRLSVLDSILEGGKTLPGMVGIGHTRWATHGAPSDINSHPQVSDGGKFAVVHNGIIENYLYLKNHLIRRGVEFVSETDTEVVAQMLEYYYKGDVLEAIRKVISRVEGSYALGIICADCPEKLFAVRKDSPLIIGIGKGENYIASDVPAILSRTRGHLPAEGPGDRRAHPGEHPVLRPGHGSYREGAGAHPVGHHRCGKRRLRALHDEGDLRAAGSPAQDHLPPHPGGEGGAGRHHPDEGADPGHPQGVHCGLRHLLPRGGGGEIRLRAAFEAPPGGGRGQRVPVPGPHFGRQDLGDHHQPVGETADTLAALRMAKSKGCRILSIVNVVGSTIANESDDVLYTWAGPEIAVASTKAYSTQLAVIYLIVLYLAQELGDLSEEKLAHYLDDLERLPDLVASCLSDKETIQYFASKYFNAHDMYFIGRNVDYAASLEASLKLKEISYIHSEAYTAGELKHGPISLLEDGTLVIAIATYGKLFDKMMSNVREVKARGAVVLGITVRGKEKALKQETDYQFCVPKITDFMLPSSPSSPCSSSPTTWLP